jgi:hypothetical protein
MLRPDRCHHVSCNTTTRGGREGEKKSIPMLRIGIGVRHETTTLRRKGEKKRKLVLQLIQRSRKGVARGVGGKRRRRRRRKRGKKERVDTIYPPTPPPLHLEDLFSILFCVCFRFISIPNTPFLELSFLLLLLLLSIYIFSYQSNCK